ncbi:HAD hydrolase family protein [Paenibacillus cremeus]|uniref:HAD family phosphatase n=1 Tax=Paenibacillus cremeus TaxID=2163881 RepID=A0A559K4C6_9BACL|nr:HAD hydrolase family protein [Paenibacillus cremeus]TVY06999.1 hypothetical protein FPZ49_26570 [Paenibacillus cremeus]
MPFVDTIVLDLDGTLLNLQKRVSDRNLAAVLDSHALGVRIIIATARPFRSVKSLLPFTFASTGADDLLQRGGCPI